MKIAADETGHVYVADVDNHRVQKFTADGTFVTQWGEWGYGDGQFRTLGDIAVDHGFVYVTDQLMEMIEHPAELRFILAHEILHAELH